VIFLLSLGFIWMTWGVVRKRVTVGVLLPLLDRLTESARHQAIGEMGAQVAHDIRSPLMVLRVGTQFLESRDPEAIGESRELILQAVHRLEGIVESLLEQRRKTLKDDALVTKPEGTSNFLSQVSIVECVQKLLREKRFEFQDRHPVLDQIDLNPEVRIEPARALELGRVLSNLINNAAEASPFGSPIEVQLSQCGTTQSLILRVKDYGAGIPASIAWSLNQGLSASSKAEGNGLGLLSARRWVESLRGSFEVTSEAGLGTSVSLRLPS